MDDKKVIIYNIEDFETRDTFECGQCFRWNREDDGSYTGVAGRHIANIFREPGASPTIIDNCTQEEYETFWAHYLDIGRDYGKIKRAVSEGDEVMADAVKCGAGIRLLRQDAWETVISFIVSQNSNIPRIKKSIETLCCLFGDSLGEYRGREYFAFPDPHVIAAMEPCDLAECRLGYRDKYIIDTARAIVSGGVAQLESLVGEDKETAAEYLMALNGVGPKVTNCILLFGLMKYDSFPLDVWIKRVMSSLYGFDEKDAKGMAEYARKHFGEYSGFAQQYLFYYIRKLSL